jgi:hypothetical protein
MPCGSAVARSAWRWAMSRSIIHELKPCTGELVAAQRL